MSARKRMPTERGLSRDLSSSVGGDGRAHSAALEASAIPKNARKGVRRAISAMTSGEAMPAATDTLAKVGRPKGQNKHASGETVQVRLEAPKEYDSLATYTASDGGGGGQHRRDAHSHHASSDISGQSSCAILRERAGSGIDQNVSDDPMKPVDPATIAAIQSLHREHRALQRAVGDMVRRIKADERWFAVRRLRAAGEPLPEGKFPDVTAADKLMVVTTRQRFFAARDAIEGERKACQKELLAMVKPLPVMGWAAGVKGLGLPSVAAIIGEAGDLAHYDNPAKLWKRMGLAVIDGKGQGKRSNAEEAAKHGYSPRRRAEIHVVGDCLVRAGGPYADLYREHKAAQMEREGITKMHAHKRALRYIEKRLLREMWQAWRGTREVVRSLAWVSPADELAGQNSPENHVRIASQGGGHSRPGTQKPNASIPPIPRKRAPSRANQVLIPSVAMPEAAD